VLVHRTSAFKRSSATCSGTRRSGALIWQVSCVCLSQFQRCVCLTLNFRGLSLSLSLSPSLSLSLNSRCQVSCVPVLVLTVLYI